LKYPPSDDEFEGSATPPPVKSVIEVGVGGRGVFYCTVDEYEEDGAVILHTHENERMNISLEDFPWKVVYKCDECGKYGYKPLACDECKVLRPRGVVQATGDCEDSDY